MRWSDVVEDASLRDLPFKVELNQHGSIVMTPASNRHAWLQSVVTKRLWDQGESGRVLVECSVATPQGVKVPDVAWLSDAFLAEHEQQTPFTAAPEVCVEVISPSNSAEEMREKQELYFAAGAREVWFCNEQGHVRFVTPDGSVAASVLFPAFPDRVS